MFGSARVTFWWGFARLLAQPSCDRRPRHQRERDADQKPRDVRPPRDFAERRAYVGEEELQSSPEADQQRRGNAHEFEEEPERQHEPESRAREQREIGADDRRYRAARADDRCARSRERQRAD